MSKYTSTVVFALAICLLGVANIVANRNDAQEMLNTGEKTTAATTEQLISCDFQIGFPQECLAIGNDIIGLLYSVYSAPQNISVSAINSLLEIYCVPECLEPIVSYYTCLGEPLTGDLLDNALCGEYNDQNCLILLATGITNSIIPLKTDCNCPQDPQCKQILQGIVNYMGCCAASLFGNAEVVASSQITPSQFASCDVDLGEMCQGLVENASSRVTVSVSLGVITLVTAIAQALT